MAPVDDVPGGAALAQAYVLQRNPLIYCGFVGRVRRSRHPASFHGVKSKRAIPARFLINYFFSGNAHART